MGDHLLSSLTAVATAIVGVAIVAVLVSKNAQSSGVIAAAGKAFSGVIGAAVSPVTNTMTGGAVAPITLGSISGTGYM
jgi:hypothetical protein